MDVEKTIEFILQTQARQQETIDSLTRVAELHSQQIGQLDGAMRTMAEAMVEAHNRTQEQFRRTDERFYIRVRLAHGVPEEPDDRGVAGDAPIVLNDSGVASRDRVPMSRGFGRQRQGRLPVAPSLARKSVRHTWR